MWPFRYAETSTVGVGRLTEEVTEADTDSVDEPEALADEADRELLAVEVTAVEVMTDEPDAVTEDEEERLEVEVTEAVTLEALAEADTTEELANGATDAEADELVDSADGAEVEVKVVESVVAASDALSSVAAEAELSVEADAMDKDTEAAVTGDVLDA